MKELNDLYDKLPRVPEGFTEWREAVDAADGGGKGAIQAKSNMTDDTMEKHTQDSKRQG